MTVLEAVNEILQRTGGYPVAALDTDGISRAKHAEKTLESKELEVQSTGWHFNTRTDVTLSPDGDGFIFLPAGAIQIDSDRWSYHRDVTQLGVRLFDKDNNTFVFTEDLVVTYVLRYDFDCIPYPIQEYIVAESAWEFLRRMGPAMGQEQNRGSMAQILEIERQKARSRAKNFNARTADVNVLQSAHALSVKGRVRTFDAAGGR